MSSSAKLKYLILLIQACFFHEPPLNTPINKFYQNSTEPPRLNRNDLDKFFISLSSNSI